MSDIDFSELTKEDLIKLLLDQNKQVFKLNNKVKTLTDDVRILKRYLYAKKSEKVTKEDIKQGLLFNETEDIAVEQEHTEKNDKVNTTTNIKPKGKSGRKKLPNSIPKNKIIADVNYKDKLCPCCDKPRPQFSTKPTQKLRFIPAQIIVDEYHINKYGECDCEEFQNREDLPRVIEAVAPKSFIPGGIATSSLVAHIIVNKFSDSLPFYRQNKIFKRIGVDISRQNMSNWTLAASSKCEPLIEYMRKYIIRGKLINMDETTLQVLNEKDRSAQTKSYMWVMTGGENNKKVVLFNYAPTRKQEKPVELLEGFNGILQTDGYAGYNKAVKDYGLWHVGCLAHSKRKFWDIAEVTEKKGLAHKGVTFFSRLYEVNNRLKEMSLLDDDFVRRRKEESIPIWQEFHKWLMINKNRVIPGSPISRAINYSLNQYKNLVRYLKYAIVPLDNNAAENAIRPFCVGRRNWLFSNTPRGAYSSAVLYSLIETAKINDIEPDIYLNYIFEAITNMGNDTDWDSLMPWNVLTALK